MYVFIFVALTVIHTMGEHTLFYILCWFDELLYNIEHHQVEAMSTTNHHTWYNEFISIFMKRMSKNVCKV